MSKKRENITHVAVSRPSELTKEQILSEEKSDTVQRLQRVAACLPIDTTIPLFEFVLDPQSYTRTIENLFDVSFLIRDEMVAISYDAEKQIHYIKRIKPIGKEKQFAVEWETAPNGNQVIFSMNMKKWKELVDLMQMKEPIIKHKTEQKSSQAQLRLIE